MDLASPSFSLDDVVALIHRLYGPPGRPEDLARVQDTLQAAQRSSSGWTLADSLLGVRDPNVQFFGALTFTVKLNSDWQSVQSETPALLSRLVGWFVRLTHAGATPLVVKKLCSTLVVFFLRFPESWSLCTRHLICSLSAGRAVEPEECANMPETAQLLQGIGPNGKLAMLWFASTLVEEVSKIDTKSAKSLEYHLKLNDNLAEAVVLIANAIEASQGDIGAESDIRVIETGLKTFQSWALYSLTTVREGDMDYHNLKPLMPIVINWLASDEMFETACSVVTDVMSSYFSFFRHEDRHTLSQILTSSWAANRYQSLFEDGSDYGAQQFVQLVVQFADATVQNLAKSLDMDFGRAIVDILHGILTVPGYPGVDDELSNITLQYWESYVELLFDSIFSESNNDPVWLEAGKQEVSKAMAGFWRKIRVPEREVLGTWSKDERDAFAEFRRNVSDLVESAYGLLGSTLFNSFVSSVVQAVDTGTAGTVPWGDVEASLYCLNAVSDDETIEDLPLEKLFGSRLFTLMSDPIGVGQIPMKAQTTAVNLIGSYATFFERRPNLLPRVLTFLFNCISTQTLARNASRSISSLCSSCRSNLAPELSAFLYQFELFTTSTTADDLAKERVLGAIAYIVQALPTEEEKIAPLSQLLGYVDKDINEALTSAAAGKAEDAKEAGLLALRCLCVIGKGLQVPDDIPTEVSDDDGLRSPSIWQTSASAMQTEILNCIRTIIAALSNDGEAIDVALSILKSGFSETSPGPFVFPPPLVVDFLLERARAGNRVESVISTATAFVLSNASGSYTGLQQSRNVSAEVARLLEYVFGLIEHFQNPQADPEIAQAVLEFLNALLSTSTYAEALLLYEPRQRLEMSFFFALSALDLSEPLAKRSAAAFWSAFLNVQVASMGERTMVIWDQIVVSIGGALAEKLVGGIGGGCARSEVDALCEPLKRLVGRHKGAKGWLEGALMRREGWPSAQVGESDKRVWVEKVVSLRGKKQTNQVCKEFWLKARGTEFAYIS